MSNIREYITVKNDKLAILVLSCDGYTDLWRPFFENFKKKWGDCPYDIYLLTNKKSIMIEEK